MSGRVFARLGGALLLLSGAYLLGFQLDYFFDREVWKRGLPLAAGAVVWAVLGWWRYRNLDLWVSVRTSNAPEPHARGKSR